MSQDSDNNEVKSRRVRVSLRPTHGTAKQVFIPSILPANKQEKEVFWVRALMTKLNEYDGHTMQVISNKDDSDGNHDVILKIDDSVIGVQVTELTYELMRKRANIRQRYLEKLLAVLQERQIQHPANVSVNVMFSTDDTDELALVKAEKLVDTILEHIHEISDGKIVRFEYGSISFQLVSEGEIYSPNFGNIGIDVNFDQLPYSLDTYTSAVKYLAEKKENSKSPWLLIWSLGFWQDKHWLGDEVVEYMQKVFKGMPFNRVFFLESLDGDQRFQNNLALYRIKE